MEMRVYGNVECGLYAAMWCVSLIKVYLLFTRLNDKKQDEGEIKRESEKVNWKRNRIINNSGNGTKWSSENR